MKAHWELGSADIELIELNERGNRGGAVGPIIEHRPPPATPRKRLTLPSRRAQASLGVWIAVEFQIDLTTICQALLARPVEIVLGYTLSYRDMFLAALGARIMDQIGVNMGEMDGIDTCVAAKWTHDRNTERERAKQEAQPRANRANLPGMGQRHDDRPTEPEHEHEGAR